MNKGSIGVFDSGVGGLTAAKVLEQILPNEDIIYFGDSARMPYGSRSKDEICCMSEQIAAFLKDNGVKAMLIACGTITTNAMDYLRSKFDVPFFGVVDAACKACRDKTNNSRIGVIATEASVRSGAYTRGIKALSEKLEVLEKPCPPFARMVEDGHFRPGDALAEKTVAEQLEYFRDKDIDTLLLGCTHYPLLSEIIADYLGHDISLVSAGAEAAYELERYLRDNDMLTDSDTEGVRRFITSGDTAVFAHCAELFLGHGIDPEQHIL